MTRGVAASTAIGSPGQPRGLAAAIVIVVASAAMVGTLPGRTQGLGLITEPLLADLGIDRVAYAQINLWATLGGALGAIGVGRLLDRVGARSVLTLVAIALGLVVIGMSQARSALGLALWITLTRGLGQSALSVVSLTVMGRTFASRPTGPMAAYSLVLSLGFMIAFPMVGSLVQACGWRSAWLAIGVALVAGLAPMGWLLLRARDWPRPANDDRIAGEDGYPFGAAVATGAFWVFALGAAAYGLVASGIGLFNESILQERGFGADVYYRTLVVTAMTALAGNFLAGAAARRWSLAHLLAGSMAVLAGGLVALPFITTPPQVYAWAAAMGLGGGCVMVLFFSVWPRLFGRRALGRIQGLAQALTVLASAIGPLLLAWGVEATGSYRVPFLTLSGVVAALGIGALFARNLTADAPRGGGVEAKPA